MWESKDIAHVNTRGFLRKLTSDQDMVCLGVRSKVLNTQILNTDNWEGASDWADRADRADSAQTPRLLQLETENQRWGSNAISDGALSWRLVRLSAKMFHCQSTILRRPAVNAKGNNRTGLAWSGTSAEYKHIVDIVWVCTSIYSTSTYEYCVSLHQYLFIQFVQCIEAWWNVVQCT